MLAPRGKDRIKEEEPSRMELGRPDREGEIPVSEGERTWRNPEYHETREILWEGGGTTPQG